MSPTRKTPSANPPQRAQAPYKTASARRTSSTSPPSAEPTREDGSTVAEGSGTVMRNCNCQTKCGGGRLIPRSTWNTHARFRKAPKLPSFAELCGDLLPSGSATTASSSGTTDTSSSLSGSGSGSSAGNTLSDYSGSGAHGRGHAGGLDEDNGESGAHGRGHTRGSHEDNGEGGQGGSNGVENDMAMDVDPPRPLSPPPQDGGGPPSSAPSAAGSEEEPPRRRFRVTVEEVPDEDDDVGGGEEDEGVDLGSDVDREQQEQRERSPEPPPPPPFDPDESEFTPFDSDTLIDITVEPKLPDLKKAMEFVDMLQAATLDKCGMSDEALDRLRCPPRGPPSIDDPDVLASVELFFATLRASQKTYEDCRQVFMRRFPDARILSYHDVRRKIAEISGVEPMVHTQCIRSCMAFTGPWANAQECPYCHEQRYDPLRHDKEIPRQTYHTMALGPQLQALRRSRSSATSARWLYDATRAALEEVAGTEALEAYEDLCHSDDFMDVIADETVGPYDSVLQLSIDGAQLYEKKQSDCWIYVWVVHTLDPTKRYKKAHVLPGAIIRGPEKPKNLESFLYPGLYHLSALMNEGLPFWDAVDNEIHVDHPFLAWVTADSPAMAYMNGLVGHNGARGCRLWCPMKGRRKPGSSHYYPVLLKPDKGYAIPGSDHDDISCHCLDRPSVLDYKTALAKVCASKNKDEYETNRKDYGIVKPSIFSGLSRTFDLPRCFPLDLMHYAALNMPALYLDLWRGTMDGDKEDKKTWEFRVFPADSPAWKSHGKEVGLSNPFLPGSYDRPPRNIAEKISSGYKAWEFLTYFYKLGPAYLRRYLPFNYWQQYCRMVRGITLAHERSVRAEDLATIHTDLNEGAIEFEELYYQRKPERIQFVRPVMHICGHVAEEIIHTGNLTTVTQWPIERQIGDLGGEIRQHSKSYANLSERAVIRCQSCALRAMLPERFGQDEEPCLPHGSEDLGEGFVLLRARARTAYRVPDAEADAFGVYLEDAGVLPEGHSYTGKIRKWSRLRLPNTQVARSAWKETQKPLERLRMSRNVKFHDGLEDRIGEVRYFCNLDVGEEQRTVALVSVYSEPDKTLLDSSYGTVYLSKYQGDAALRVIDVTAIKSVVAMVPDVHRPRTATTPQLILGDDYFLAERMGMGVMRLAGRDLDDIQAEE